MGLAVEETLMPVEGILDWPLNGERWRLIGGSPTQIMSESGLHETVETNFAKVIGPRMRIPLAGFGDCVPHDGPLAFDIPAAECVECVSEGR